MSFNSSTNQPYWVTEVPILQPPPPDNFADWLEKPRSISDAMRKLCATLSLKIMCQQHAAAYQYEVDELHLDLHGNHEPTVHNLPLAISEMPLVREIFLLGDNVPWSFGRVIIPPKTYLAYKNTFDSLGNKFIGEAFLYGANDVVRSKFKYACIRVTTLLYERVHSYLNSLSPGNQSGLVNNATTAEDLCHLWARHSVFNIASHPLMITEIYLPTIPKYPIDHE
jgi:chorismate lyase